MTRISAKIMQCLLNQCRSLDEIACIMNVPGLHTLNRVEVRGTQSKLSVLNFAIANVHVRACCVCV